MPANALGGLFRPDAFRTIGPYGVPWGRRNYWSEAVPDRPKRDGETRTYAFRADPVDPRTIEIRVSGWSWVRLHARWV